MTISASVNKILTMAMMMMMMSDEQGAMSAKKQGGSIYENHRNT
jgi:hypothetical protein